MSDDRRRASRQQAGWVGKWRLEDDPGPTSTECNVLNVSMLGAEVEISRRPQLDLVGQRITITAQPLAGGSVSVRFAGTIRRMSPAPKSQFRLGIEFAGLSEDELAVLDALGQFLKGI
jgi:PilZ domain-containing protein